MGDQQAFAGARATDIEEMALPLRDEPPGVVAISAGERATQGHVLCIAADEGDGSEFKALGGVHRADRDRIRCEVAIGRQPPAGETRLREGWFRALEDNLPGPSKDCDLPWLDAARTQVAQPMGERCCLVLDGFSRDYFRLGTAQDRNRLANLLHAVDFSEL
jgi:hypothetical protein